MLLSSNQIPPPSLRTSPADYRFLESEQAELKEAGVPLPEAEKYNKRFPVQAIIDMYICGFSSKEAEEVLRKGFTVGDIRACLASKNIGFLRQRPQQDFLLELAIQTCDQNP